MSVQVYTYIIVGAGLAGASAVDAIRERDSRGSIALFGDEAFPPYHRPPLSKKLWLGTKTVDEIFIRPESDYPDKGVELFLDSRIIRIDPKSKEIFDQNGRIFVYEKLLLATGGKARLLEIPGCPQDEIHYLRTLSDYHSLRSAAGEKKSALIIGGGFIGAEMAAALTFNNMFVHMIFSGPYPLYRVFPSHLGMAIRDLYEKKGVRLLEMDQVISAEKRENRFLVRTKKENTLSVDLILAGIGLIPETKLAEQAGLEVSNGIVVNEFLQTSNPDIYAAGDNTFFPSPVLEKSLRLEHWDNAVQQGETAGRNLAGSGERFDALPYFFSDLFEWGFEAVGEISPSLETIADWKKENETGVIYFLRRKKVHGVLLCNVWGKVEAARAIIRNGEEIDPPSLIGAIR